MNHQKIFFYTPGRDKGKRASEKKRGFALGVGIVNTMMAELPADVLIRLMAGFV